jgi:multisubunit Na+/H+ antiporter MnhF subunit
VYQRQRISIKLNRCDQLYKQHTAYKLLVGPTTRFTVMLVDALRERACFIFLIKLYCSLALEQSTNKIMIQQPCGLYTHSPIVCKKAPGSFNNLYCQLALNIAAVASQFFIMIANYLSAHTFLKRPKLPIKLLVLQERPVKMCEQNLAIYALGKTLGCDFTAGNA